MAKAFSGKKPQHFGNTIRVFLNYLGRHKSVSYTHLDVYKRQAVYDMKYLTSRLRRIFCLFGGTGSITKAP